MLGISGDEIVLGAISGDEIVLGISGDEIVLGISGDEIVLGISGDKIVLGIGGDKIVLGIGGDEIVLGISDDEIRPCSSRPPRATPQCAAMIMPTRVWNGASVSSARVVFLRLLRRGAGSALKIGRRDASPCRWLLPA